MHSVLAQNKLLAISVSSLLSKDDIPVYRDMLSILTPDIHFRIPLNFIGNIYLRYTIIMPLVFFTMQP